ncbi:uncharacterized protein [Procambarus clarkii]|uniref:uncharacterized protein n=1 Tax=Procambarus clarkii TaxID=6728 RepID=UPI003742E1B3
MAVTLSVDGHYGYISSDDCDGKTVGNTDEGGDSGYGNNYGDDHVNDDDDDNEGSDHDNADDDDDDNSDNYNDDDDSRDNDNADDDKTEMSKTAIITMRLIMTNHYEADKDNMQKIVAKASNTAALTISLMAGETVQSF